MKKTKLVVICLLFAVIFSSCGEVSNKGWVDTKKYSLSTTVIVPDSLKKEYADWVKETVKAASQNMTGGDYEDVDETIEQAQSSGEKIFGREVRCLRIKYGEYDYSYVPCDRLDSIQKIIYDKLLNNFQDMSASN